MRKRLNPVGYALIVLIALWISAEVRLRQLQHRLAALWTYTGVVKMVDETSGAPLPPNIQIPSSDKDDLPIVFSGDVANGGYKHTIISDIPVSFGFSSPGYRSKRVSIDKDSPANLEIRLSKE